jgi:hypothetical protein
MAPPSAPSLVSNAVLIRPRANLGDAIGYCHGAGAADILDDHGLAKDLTHPLREQVGGTSFGPPAAEGLTMVSARSVSPARTPDFQPSQRRPQGPPAIAFA